MAYVRYQFFIMFIQKLVEFVVFFVLHCFATDLTHVTCRTRSDTPKSDIDPYERLIFEKIDSKAILWSMYFNIPSCLKCTEQLEIPANFHVACGPYFELDYERSIQEVITIDTNLIKLTCHKNPICIFRQREFSKNCMVMKSFCRERRIRMKSLLKVTTQPIHHNQFSRNLIAQPANLK